MPRKCRTVWMVAVVVALSPAMRSATAAEETSRGLGGVANRSLAEEFASPPPSARPGVYWVWLNGVVDRAQLVRDLEEYKAKGIAKAYIFDCGARDPEDLIPEGPPFMGRESLETIGHAIREAMRLGIEIGLTTSSSWNAGGPWVTPEHASMGLVYSQTVVRGPSRFSDILPFPKVPSKTPKGPGGRPLYHKDVAVVAVRAAEVESAVVEDVDSVVDLSDRLDENGRLAWDVPAGTWTVLRFVCTNTGQALALPSPKSQGLAIDHFSADATRMHFEFFIDKLQQELGDLTKTALTTLYLCSYELRGAAWTPDFLQQFERRRGYDMTRYLPVLAGTVIQSKKVSDRFLHDYRKTQGDLLVDAFYRTAREVCRSRGLLLCAEAGGPGPPLHQVPVDALKAQGAVDIARGEFWTDEHYFVVKETACAAHVYGKRIVDQEAFTSWAHWQYGPFDLKPLADRALCDGANLFTFHMSPHSPPEAGLPGWVYHAGTHINPNLVWWPKAGPFVDYLARCSHLLQQGLFVGDVCYYYGDEGFNFVPPKQVDPSLGFGYDYDVVNPEVILTRMKAAGGRLVLPDGMNYEILVLPDDDAIDLEVLRKLEELVRAGATVVGRKPVLATGLAGYPQSDAEVHDIAERMWGPCDGETVTEHACGAGKVIWGPSPREILEARGVGPDFRCFGRHQETALDYLHRRDGETDIYFVRNKNERWAEADCVFRVAGKAPELWMPDAGQIRKQLVYRAVEGGTQVPIRLGPHGSVFVVFREKAPSEHLTSVRPDRISMFPALPSETPEMAEVEVFRGDQGEVELMVSQPGAYVLETSRGGRRKVDVASVPQARELGGPWEVFFPADWGAPASQEFPKLISWTEHGNEGIKYFSGTARYETEFEIPAELLTADLRLFLDLGQVKNVANVAVNGQVLGILWKPPFAVEITAAANPGANRLTVEVANTWSNRLVGDAQSTDGKTYCRTNMTRSLTWRRSWKDTPLLDSGLLGPVRLVPVKRIRIGP